MSSVEQLRKGLVLRHEGRVYMVMDFVTAQSGKQKPTVHLKLRDLKSGNAADRTLDQIGKIEEVEAETRTMQYLYASGAERVFMDTESFEQYSVGKEVLHHSIDFLVEEQTYKLFLVEGRVAGLELPEIVVLSVAETAPGEHGSGLTTVTKEAVLDSGLTIHVPLFIKTGDKIRVNTATRQYVGKEH